AISQAARAQGAVLITIDPAIPAEHTAAAAALTALKQMGFVPSPQAQGSFGGTQPRYVMKMDISGTPEELLAGFHQKWRYNIRLGQRKGLVVQSDCTKDDLKLFHDIYTV